MTNCPSDEIEVRDYFPGAIGKIVELHGAYYHDYWGFDVSFESQVSRELGEFMSRRDPQRDGFWTALVDGRFAGAVAVDGRQEIDGEARLRWLIVEPTYHKRGIGGILVKRAVEFSRNAGHKRVFLWTFKGLNSARRVYESEGFRLAEEHEIEQWGGIILEQKFELVFPAGSD